MEDFKIKKNKFGYYEVSNKPTKTELKDHYKNKYYQEESIQYSHLYDEEEKRFFSNEMKIIYQFFLDNNVEINTVLDVGCGEGFVVKFFTDLGLDVNGIDFSDYGIKKHNNDLIDKCIFGDTFEILEDIEKKYDLVILKNVLEHVIDPEEILEKLKNKLTDEGTLLIIVPNDFSDIQNYLYSNNMINRKFWVCPPEHLTYFGYESLKKLVESHNYNIVYKLTEYPIDLDLFGENTNYINDDVGKFSHKRRIKITNFLCENCDISKITKYYNSMTELGLGRQIIYYLKK